MCKVQSIPSKFTCRPPYINILANKRHLRSQVLQETIAIEGTPLYLVYQSSKRDGYYSLLHIRLTGPKPASNLKSLQIIVSVEGATSSQSFQSAPDLVYTFMWDKKNVFQQLVYGIVDVKGLELKYVYILLIINYMGSAFQIQ